MGLLDKRPLARFCACFLVAICLGLYLTPSSKCFAIALLLLCTTALFAAGFLAKRYRKILFSLTICLLAGAIAVFHLYVRIDRQKEKALAYTGDRTVEFQVLSAEYADSVSSQYTVEILRIGDDSVEIRSFLICGFSANLHAGDRVLARVNLKDVDEVAYAGIRPRDQITDDRILLSTVLYDEEDASLISCAEDENPLVLLNESNGIELLSDRLRANTVKLFETLLGRETSVLARAFFMGDTSELPIAVKRDFRRSGVSHLLAVSGLHISVLLGSIELLLRKLSVHKKLRCLAVAIIGILLLSLTGFSMSACRAVFMLFCVYLCYFFAEDADPLTTLFAVVTLILIFSPYSAFDLGLWMSFLATLALLSLYPAIESRIPRKLFEKRFPGLLWRILRGAILILVMSAVCNLFLLPILCSVFREISLVTLPTNLVLSHLGVLYLCAIPIVLLLAPIPFIGNIAVSFLEGVGNLLCRIVAFFSRFDFAVLSLRYPFAEIIVFVLTLMMAVLLLVRLSRRWLLAIPPAVAAVAFCICLSVTFAKEGASVTYLKYDSQRTFVLTDNGQGAICDLSSKDIDGYFSAADVLREQAATDVDVLILGHISDHHPDSFDAFSNYEIIHTLCVPCPETPREENLLREIAKIADEKKITVLVYESGEEFTVFGDLALRVFLGDSPEERAFSVFDGERRMTYADLCAPWSEPLRTLCSNSQMLVLSCDGDGVSTLSDTAKTEWILFDVRTNKRKNLPSTDDPKIYYSPENKRRWLVSFPLKENEE